MRNACTYKLHIRTAKGQCLISHVNWCYGVLHLTNHFSTFISRMCVFYTTVDSVGTSPRDVDKWICRLKHTSICRIGFKCRLKCKFKYTCTCTVMKSESEIKSVSKSKERKIKWELPLNTQVWTFTY